MRSLSTLLLVWLAAAYNVIALSAVGNRLLVVLEDADEKPKYSTLTADLESRGFQISFSSPKADKLSLFALGERAYDHVLLLPPKAKAYGPNLTPQLLLEFLNNDGNILLGLSGNTPTPNGIVSLLLELDIHIPTDKASLVVDHFSYDGKSSPEQHNVLLVEPPKSGIRADVKNYFAGSKPIAFPRAVAQILGNSSPHLMPILRASSTSYVHNPKEEALDAEDIFATGSQISLASAFQARNSARFTVLGSIEALQDEFMSGAVMRGEKEVDSGNREFAKQITGWTFKELGVLKVGRLQHHLNEGALKGLSNESAVPASQLSPKIYRVKNDVTCTIEISEYNFDQWTPFLPPSNDELQLEFTMLSPFHRLALQATSQTQTSSIFSTSFTVPDQHGIFNFRVNYKRPFLTIVDEKLEVTVRHFAHDEWPRSFVIGAAWPWIAGVWGTVGGFVAFCAVWLYSEPKKVNVKKVQ